MPVWATVKIIVPRSCGRLDALSPKVARPRLIVRRVVHNTEGSCFDRCPYQAWNSRFITQPSKSMFAFVRRLQLHVSLVCARPGDSKQMPVTSSLCLNEWRHLAGDSQKGLTGHVRQTWQPQQTVLTTLLLFHIEDWVINSYVLISCVRLPIKGCLVFLIVYHFYLNGE